MSKDPRDDAYKYDPMESVRKPVPPPGKVIHGKKYNKTRIKRKEQEIIQEGLDEYYKDTDKGEL